MGAGLKRAVAAAKATRTKALMSADQAAEANLKALAVRAAPFQKWAIWRVENAGELSDGQLADLKGAFVAAKGLLDEIDKKRREITDPLNLALKRMNAQAKAVREPIERFTSHAGLLLGAAQAARQEAAEKEVAKIAKAAEKKGNVQLAADIRKAAADGAMIGGAGVAFRSLHRAEIQDLDRLLFALCQKEAEGWLDATTRNALRAALMEPLTTALGALARATKGAIEVPGVRFYQEQSVGRSSGGAL